VCVCVCVCSQFATLKWKTTISVTLELCLKGRDLSEDLDIDGRIILEWILGK